MAVTRTEKPGVGTPTGNRIPQRRRSSPRTSRTSPDSEHLLRVSKGAREWLKQRLHATNVSDLRGSSLNDVKEAVSAVARSSDEQLYVALATAYALFVELSETDAHPLMISMAKAVGRPLVRKDALRIIVEALLPYGEAGIKLASPARADKKRAAQQLHSRDVRAISFLASSGVSPADVVDRAKRKGQGVVAWANAMATLRRSDPTTQRQTRNPNVFRLRMITPTGRILRLKFENVNKERVKELKLAYNNLRDLSRKFADLGTTG